LKFAQFARRGYFAPDMFFLKKKYWNLNIKQHRNVTVMCNKIGSGDVNVHVLVREMVSVMIYHISTNAFLRCQQL